MSDAPEVPATVLVTLSGAYILKIRCPYCQSEHKHGGGSAPKPRYGHRQAHCALMPEGARAGYVLVPTEESK